MYWETIPDIFVQVVSDSMSRNWFKRILRTLHLCDNAKLDNTNKFCKLRPMIMDLNNKYLKHSFNGENKSIDESMIPYFDTHGSRQRINNKSICVGYKFWVLAETYGYVIQFETYQGAKVGKLITSQTRWSLGEKVVLDLIESLLKGVSFHVYMDNYFTSLHLLVHLGEHNIHATRDLPQKDLAKCDIRKQFEKKARSYTGQKTSTNKYSKKVTVDGWNDKRAVYLASNCPSSVPAKSIRRWKKVERKYIQINQPSFIVGTKIWVLWIEWIKTWLSI